jgi:formamidopyrimidine-DNA glycosylase
VPELPEVETIRRHLAPHVEGRRITALDVADPRWSGPLAPEQIVDAVVGRHAKRLGRRGKYLIWELEADVFLLVHLRMTGTLLLDPGSPSPHTRVCFELDAGAHRVAFVDPRRFGTGELALGTAALDEFLSARLGIEPFDPDFTGHRLHALTRRRRAPIKAFLLDQREIAGVGNIYADEALFRAGIHPLRPAGRLTRPQCEALRDAVVDALRAGIEAKGATIDDFRHPDGVQGSFQDQFLVHRRADLPCPSCGRPVLKLRAAGRGTYVCEICQPKPRRAAYAAAARSSSRPARSAADSS